MARLAYLFDDSDDLEDAGAAKADEHMDSMAARDNFDRFMTKLDNHLNVEKALIDDWTQQSKLKKQRWFYNLKLI